MPNFKDLKKFVKQHGDHLLSSSVGDNVRKYVDQARQHNSDPSNQPPTTANPDTPETIPHNHVMNYVQMLLYGLTKICTNGSPGAISLSGPSAFCVVTNSKGGCAVGAAEYGSGRVVAMSHNSMVTAVRPKGNQDTIYFNTFNRNAVAWASRNECRYVSTTDCSPCTGFSFELYPFLTPKLCNQPIKVGGIGWTTSEFENYVKGVAGVSNIFTTGTAVKHANLTSIRTVLASAPDVIVWTNTHTEIESVLNLDTADERAVLLSDYVRQGGGLVTAVCPWGWQSLAKGKATIANNFLFNHVLSDAGLEYNSGVAGPDSSGCYDVNLCIEKSKQQPPAALLEKAVQQLTAGTAELNSSEFQSAVSYLQDLPASAFKDSSRGRSAAADLLESVQRLALTQGKATCKFPLDVTMTGGTCKSAQASAILYILWLRKKTLNVDPRDIYNYLPDVETFPGAVSPLIPRVQNYLASINPYLDRYQTIGLYVPPGETVTMMISDEALKAYGDSLNFDVRVGVHSDWLKLVSPDGKYQLQRHARIIANRRWQPTEVGEADNLPFSDQSAPAKTNSIVVGSVYGGPLYVKLNQVFAENRPLTAPLVFQITGGVYMLYCNVQRERGEVPWSTYTDSYPYNMQWSQRVAQFAGAPWGEIEGRYVSILAPASALAKVADPIAAIEFWDKVEEHYLALSGQKLQGKEKVVGDKQISAGYMHSGYPIMGHLDIYQPAKGRESTGIPMIFDLDNLRKSPAWGVYHELGHNRQQGVWTWGGLTEVTVNIFSLYASHMMNGLSPYKSGYYVNNCRSRVLEWVKSGKTNWREHINTSLGLYVVFIEEFGWEAISKTFRRYLAGSWGHLKTDEDKQHEWIRQTSLATGIDLRNFYSQWKWSIPSNLSELDGLQKWNKNLLQVLQAN